MAPRRQRILVISADRALRRLISQILHGSSFDPLQADDVTQALAAPKADGPQAVVIDLAATADVEAACRQLRQRLAAPILAIIPRGQAAALHAALDGGADDFVTVPFSAEELLARTQVVIGKRTDRPPGGAGLRLGAVEIDLHGQRLLRNGQPVALSRTDWALLEALVRHRGQALTHRMLLEQVWGEAYSQEHGYLRTYVNRLRSKIEADPHRPRYLQTVARIGYRFVIPADEQGPAAAPGRPEGPARLPIPPTSFVGRGAELAAIGEALQGPDLRLLTLTGPGGVGKTRLALQSAAAVEGHFADGAIFVSLAAARTPAALVTALGKALQVRESGDEPLLERVRQALAPRDLLLILDNCEQIPDAAPLLSDLLQGCPGLTLLATSRSRLQLSGERELVVPPLAVPDPGHSGAAGALLDLPAVALFLDRVRAVVPGYAPRPDEIPVLAAICARLDGLPLAIELAAAWARLLPPAAIAARLGRPLDLLTGGVRDLPDRQQTMRSALAWSYDLLSPPRRRLFGRLGVFVGGGALEAIEQICGEAGEPPLALLEGLAALVDASLLQRLPTDDPRFTMLDTIREYARERLEESGELADLQRRHAGYYLALAEPAGTAASGSDQIRWLDQLEREHDNLRAALEWAHVAGERELLLRLSGALWNFWHRHGHQSEGRRWLAEALETGAQLPPALRSRALLGMGWLAYDQRDYAQAGARHRESLELSRSLDDWAGVAEAQRGLGELALSQGSFAQARELFEQSLALSCQGGHAEGQAWSLNHLGRVALEQGEYAQARALLERSLAHFRQLHLQAGITWSLHSLGRVALEQGEYAQARDLFVQGLGLARTLGDKTGVAWSLHNLGRAALEQGDHGQARGPLEQSLAHFRQLNDRSGVAWAHHTLGRLAGAADDRERARAHFAESLALFSALADAAGLASSQDQLRRLE